MGFNHLEIAVAEWVDWYNFRRLHGELGHVPPVEYERVNAVATAPETPRLDTAETFLGGERSQHWAPVVDLGGSDNSGLGVRVPRQ
ncbi:IS3 family transposase [Arthrobacter sp. KK5.5]|uniref:IS3 family transposase n=1 Tax=Arthrobacter sp. KK5.5 TaxID=3373084 RepID=UPI003EE5567F